MVVTNVQAFSGDVEVASNLTVSNINFTGTFYQNGQVFKGSPWTTTSGNVTYTAGNVGIGTNSPTSNLHVLGEVRLQKNVTLPSTNYIYLADRRNGGTNIACLQGISGNEINNVTLASNAFIFQGAPTSNITTPGLGLTGDTQISASMWLYLDNKLNANILSLGGLPLIDVTRTGDLQGYKQSSTVPIDTKKWNHIVYTYGGNSKSTSFYLNTKLTVLDTVAHTVISQFPSSPETMINSSNVYLSYADQHRDTTTFKIAAATDPSYADQILNDTGGYVFGFDYSMFSGTYSGTNSLAGFAGEWFAFRSQNGQLLNIQNMNITISGIYFGYADFSFVLLGSTESNPTNSSSDWSLIYSGTTQADGSYTFPLNNTTSYTWVGIVFTNYEQDCIITSLSFGVLQSVPPPTLIASNVAILGSNTLASVTNFRIYNRVLNPLEIEQLYEYDRERLEGIPLNNVTYNKSLGIQNKSPMYNLDVTGDINVSSNVYHDGSLLMYKTGNFIHKQLGENIVDYSQDYIGSSVSISRDGSVVALGSNITSEVGIYKWTGYKWLQKGSRLNRDYNFGYSLSLSADGNIVAIGEPFSSVVNHIGSVRIYEWTGSAWYIRGSVIDGHSIGDHFGASVSLTGDGNVVAIGAPNADSNRGYTFVYEWSQLNYEWVQKGTTPMSGDLNDFFGTCVSLSNDGNRVAIAAPGNNTGGVSAGRVITYEWSGTEWTQLGSVIDGVAGDLLGSDTSVSLSGDGLTLAIGAPGNYIGSVKFYDLLDSSWVSAGYIKGEASGDKFGTSVSLSDNGTRVIVGAPYNDGTGTNSGHARIYNRNGILGVWTQIDGDIDGITTNANFGESVSISGDGTHVIIGKNRDQTNDGLVQVYKITKPTHVAEDIVVDNTLNTKDMNLSNTFFINNTAIFRGDYTALQMGSDINGEAADDESGYSVSLSNDGTRVAIGAPYNDGTGLNAGHTRVYEWSGTVWTKMGLDIDAEAEGDYAGYSVSISGDGTRVAIGAYFNDGTGLTAGHTRVYEWSGTVWTKMGLDIDGEAEIDRAGSSVSLSNDGTRVAIGAPLNDGTGPSAGHTRVYEWSGTEWTKMGSDIDGEAVGDNSGFSVSLSGDGTRVAIGAPYNDEAFRTAGHTRVYEWSGTEWTKMGSDIDGEAKDDYAGQSVSLSNDGTRVAIGAPIADSSRGYTRVYEWSGTEWTKMGSDIGGEAVGDNSGKSVSLSGDGTRVAIGAFLNDGTGGNAGHTRVYEWSGTEWTKMVPDIDAEAADDRAGRSVSISGDGTRVAIGAHLNDGTGGNAGHTRVYDIAETVNAISDLRGSNNVIIGPKDGQWWRLYTYQTTGNLGFIGDDGVEHGYLVDSGTVANIDFTGQHRAIVDQVNVSDYESLEGLIVSANKNKYVNVDKDVTTGSNAIQISQSLPVVRLSNVVHDKACYGVIAGSEDPKSRKYEQGTFVSVFEKQKEDTRALINSVGEGAIWVINSNGSLESGDYITTSNIAGYGQKQNDDILHNYTVAKITMDCDFNPATQPVQRILRSNVVNTYYLANVHQVKSVPHESVTTIVTADDTWSNVYIEPPHVTYEEWLNLDANVQNEFTLTYTQTSNVVYDVKYTHTTTGDDKTPDEWSTLESNVQSLYNKVYYQSVERKVNKDYPGAVAHTRVINTGEIELDEYGHIQWEDHPTETEKAYKIRFLDANGVETDEDSHVYKAAFVGCTYHCG